MPFQRAGRHCLVRLGPLSLRNDFTSKWRTLPSIATLDPQASGIRLIGNLLIVSGPQSGKLCEQKEIQECTICKCTNRVVVTALDLHFLFLVSSQYASCLPAPASLHVGLRLNAIKELHDHDLPLEWLIICFCHSNKGKRRPEFMREGGDVLGILQ